MLEKIEKSGFRQEHAVSIGAADSGLYTHTNTHAHFKFAWKSDDTTRFEKTNNIRLGKQVQREYTTR